MNQVQPFDAASHLQDEATIRAYLQAALGDSDPAALLLALQNATKALQEIFRTAKMTKPAQ